MMLDSEGRWFRSQGQTLWLSVAEEQKVWGHYIPFSPNRLRCSSPGPACLLLKSIFSFSYIGESFTGGQAGLFTPTLLYGRPDLFIFFTWSKTLFFFPVWFVSGPVYLHVFWYEAFLFQLK